MAATIAVIFANRELDTVSAAFGDVAQLGTAEQQLGDTISNYVVPAGTNRMLIVTASDADATEVDGVSYDGLPMTLAVDRSNGFVDSIWYLPLGTSANSVTGDVQVTGFSTSQVFLTAQSYEFVDQDDPFTDVASDSFTGPDASSTLTVFTNNGDLAFELYSAFSSSGTPNRFISGPLREVLHDADITTATPLPGGEQGWTTTIKPGVSPSVTLSWISNGEAVSQLAVVLKNDPVPPVCTVTSALDSGAGTLREKVTDAGCPAIEFDFTAMGTTAINLLSPLSNVSRTLSITGFDRDPVISGDGSFRMLQVVPGGDLTINNLTVSGFGNNTSSVFLGGAINNDGSLSVVDSTFSNNIVGNAFGNGSFGGAIASTFTSSLTITRSTFAGNQVFADLGSGGGAIYAQGAFSVVDSTFSNNQAGVTGGAIQKDTGAAWTIKGSTFSQNSLTQNGAGGAIETRVPLTVSNSTFNANTAPVAAAIEVSGASAGLTLIHSTISGNTASSGTAAGIRVGNVIPNVSNSIIADNTGTDCQVIPGMNDTGHNLDSDGTCSFDITGDPDLGPLADNGGLTETMALGPASLALNAGDDTICAAAPVSNLDQRGETRPAGSHCDLGAFEAQSLTCTVTSALDSGTGTLREKMADSSCSSIDFDLVAMGATTINLASALPAVDRELSITGQNRLPVIDGGDATLLMSVTTTGDLTLGSLTFSNGKSTTGGAIYSDGILDISDCLFEDNTSSNLAGSAYGGAILAWTDTTTTVTGSTFLRNKAEGSAPPVLGGAIHTRGELSVSDSTFEENEANDGGAIQCLIACTGHLSGALLVSGSTFAGNTATNSGGAMQASGSIHVKNSTFFDNEAPLGGAVRAADAALFFVTMSGNTSAAGSALSVTGDASVVGSLFVNNNGPTCHGIVQGPLSFSTDSSCLGFTVTPAPFAIGSLQDNGGPTHTMALPAGSPAIDAGPATCAGAPVFSIDQRGVSRPIGAGCDLGAYEAPPTTPVTITVPAGISFTFNAVTYTGPQTINVAPGNYTLSTTSPQVTAPGTRAVFASWSDLGAISHTVNVASTPLSVTGTFTTQYQLTTIAGAGGSVAPASGQFFDANAVVPVSATPNPGFVFGAWTGPVANSASASTTVTMTAPLTISASFIGLPDLSLKKTVNNPAPFVGQTVHYAVTVSNTGFAPATGVIVGDVLPAGVEFVSATTSQGSLLGSPPTLSWNVGTVNPGFPATLQVTVKVLSAGTITNLAQVTAQNEQDADSIPNDGVGDDAASVSFTSTASAQLSITKSNGAGSVNPGSTVNYTITIANGGPSPADGTLLKDAAVPGMTKSAIVQCNFAGGAACPGFGNGAGQLGITNLEAGTVVIPVLPVGGTVQVIVAVTITASSGFVTNTAIATPPVGTSGAAVLSSDIDAVIDTQPPVVTPGGPVNGATYTLPNVPPLVCTTSDPPPGSGVAVPASPTYSGGNVNGAGVITASCVGGKDNAGSVAPPVSVTYTVVCAPTATYQGVLPVKVGFSATYQVSVTAVVSLNTATCAVTGVALTSAANSTGAVQLNTVTNWKPPVQPAAGQWSFAMKTVNAATGGIFLGNAYRAMDGSSSLLVKFVNNRANLYMKLSGMAPTGVGINKASFEAETASLVLVP